MLKIKYTYLYTLLGRLNTGNTHKWPALKFDFFSRDNVFRNAVCQASAILLRPQLVSTLFPSNAICLHISRTKLAQLMACCLTAASHYLNQYWLPIDGPLWHVPERNWTRSWQEFNLWHEWENTLLHSFATYSEANVLRLLDYIINIIEV